MSENELYAHILAPRSPRITRIAPSESQNGSNVRRQEWRLLSKCRNLKPPSPEHTRLRQDSGFKVGCLGRTRTQHRGTRTRTRTRFNPPILRYSGGSLDQSSQHRYDLLPIAFAASIGFIVNRIEYPQDIMKRSTF